MPKKIKIITDSVCDIPDDLLEKWNISVIPCYVSYDGESYADDGVELDRSSFYKKIPEMSDFPKTAAPPPAVAQQYIEEALQDADAVVCVHVAEVLSGTYNNVRIAAHEFPEGTVTVLDSKALSMGIGWQALRAAEVAAETGAVDAVVQAVNEVREKNRLYAYIDTMDFLRRSGRVNSVVAGIGSLLQIKPIVTVTEQGDVESVHRIRTSKKALSKLADLLRNEGELESLAIIHTMNEQGARDFKAKHADLMPENTIITEVGPTLGTHIGMGSLGFVSVRK